MTREELIEKKRQETQLKEYKKQLKERVELLELEYKELYYITSIPKLKLEYFKLLEEAQEMEKQHKEEVEIMKEKMQEENEEKPKAVKKSINENKNVEKSIELNPEE